VPATVMDAFLDVISADEERSTAINRAEAYAAAVIPEALGEAAATHQRALGEADLIAAEAAGWSAVFTAISDGGAAAPALTRHRLREEALVESLSEQPLVLIPSTMSLWLGDSPPGIPRMEGTREE
jgi:membrane protease subunit HflK